MRPRRPDFVIIGAQKAGSSLLHHALRAHPDIWLRPSEDPFFRDPVFREDGLGEFASAYAGRPQARIGMKCPDYLARPEVPVRLHDHLSAPDVIVALRNPVDRAVSAYYWMMRWGVIPLRPPEEGLREILARAVAGRSDMSTDILEWGLYGRHLTTYLGHFARSKIHIIVEDALRSDPGGSVRGVYEFLGVRSDIALPTASTRDNAGVYSMERLRVLRRRTKYVLQWDDTGTYASIPKPRGPRQRAYSNAVAAWDRYVLARRHPNSRPRLSPELNADLHAYFRSDIAVLEELLGSGLPVWRPDTAAGRAVPPHGS